MIFAGTKMNVRRASRYPVHMQKVSLRGNSAIRKEEQKIKMNQLLENRAVPASFLEAQSVSRLLS